jgi:lysophospholipase L1-like esterase
MRTARKLALSVAVFAGAAAALELGLRGAGYERPEPPPIVVMNPWDDAEMETGESAFRFDGELLWELRPGAPIRPPLGPPAPTDAQQEVVNPAGFRGPGLAPEPVPGRLRIATLGDSSTFGYGVAYEDTYGERLVELLGERGVEAEVLDAGVVGYTALQGLVRYRRDVRRYRPDVVVAAFGAINDALFDPLNDIDKMALESRRGGLVRWLDERSRTMQWLSELGAGTRTPHRSERGPSDPPVSPAMPEGNVPRVSLEAFEDALLELARLVREDGARFVVISMPRLKRTEKDRPHLPSYSQRVVALAEREGWPLVDARTLFREHDETRSLLIDPVHPSASGHDLIARALLDVLPLPPDEALSERSGAAPFPAEEDP